jgi:hypothetical protein
MPHTLSIPALIGHKTFDTLDPGFYAMKGNDTVWLGVIITENRSCSSSPASIARENSVMKAGCPPTISEYRDVEGKPFPSVKLSYSKDGRVTATGSEYQADSR